MTPSSHEAQTHSAGRSHAIRNQDPVWCAHRPKDWTQHPRRGPVQCGGDIERTRLAQRKGRALQTLRHQTFTVFLFVFFKQNKLVWGVKIKELEGEAKVGMVDGAGFCDGCVARGMSVM